LDERLGIQLVRYYLSGTDTLAGDGLVARFFARVNPVTGRDVIHEFGWAFWRDRDAEREPDVVDRLTRLWEWWAARVEAEGRFEDLGVFAWWFASGLFPWDRGFAELRRIAELDVSIEAAHAAVERMAELVSIYPVEVGRTLDLLLARTSRDEEYVVAREAVRTIVSALTQHPNADAADLGQAIRSRLIGRGHDDPIG
jgi:hypothetical protein